MKTILPRTIFAATLVCAALCTEPADGSGNKGNPEEPLRAPALRLEASGESVQVAAPSVFGFVPGHYYSSANGSSADRVIKEYDEAGEIVGLYTVPSALGEAVRGLAFGADGLLYLTMSRGPSGGLAVLALASNGDVIATYAALVNISSNSSFGKIAMDNQYVYVCGYQGLARFALGNPSSGTVIYTATNGLYDVKTLPNGHLFVASGSDVDEITNSGTFVRRIQLTSTTQSFSNIRGLEFNPATNILFVSHLGYTDFDFRIMRVNATTGALLGDTRFVYADDMFLDTGANLLVGSSTQIPRFYSQNLVQQNSLAGGGPQGFVTQYVPLTAQGAVSRQMHGGVGTFDIVVSSVECRAGGSNGDYGIVATFPNAAFVTGTPQAQVNSGTGMIGSGGISNGGTVAVDGNTVTIPLTGVANAQTLILQLNGVLSGPSRGNLPLSLTVLVGDTNGDGIVNAGDGLQTRNRSGQTADASTFRSDVNADGFINSGDTVAVRSRSGTSVPLPTPTPTPTPAPTPCTFESFDSVTAPALPAGWVATNFLGDSIRWVTSTATPHTAPNCAFLPNQGSVSAKVLVTPTFMVNSPTAELVFRNNYNMEADGAGAWDGCILEVSSPNINGGAFTDIIDPAVGGGFVTGGYNVVLVNGSSNPLQGRAAWGEDSGGYIKTIAKLGPNVNGQMIKLRFVMGTDQSVGAPGWRIDSLSLTDGTCPTVAP